MCIRDSLVVIVAVAHAVFAAATASCCYCVVVFRLLLLSPFFLFDIFRFFSVYFSCAFASFYSFKKKKVFCLCFPFRLFKIFLDFSTVNCLLFSARPVVWGLSLFFFVPPPPHPSSLLCFSLRSKRGTNGTTCLVWLRQAKKTCNFGLQTSNNKKTQTYAFSSKWMNMHGNHGYM